MPATHTVEAMPANAETHEQGRRSFPSRVVVTGASLIAASLGG